MRGFSGNNLWNGQRSAHSSLNGVPPGKMERQDVREEGWSSFHYGSRCGRASALLRGRSGLRHRVNRAAAALLLGLSAAASSAPADRVRVLEDFEGGAGHWRLRQASLELVAADPGTGSAARLQYPRWTRGAVKWPSARLHFGEGGFDVGDWSDFTSLKFEARSLLAGTAHLKLRIDDAEGRRAVRILAVSADTTTTCAVSIAGLREEIDTRRVRLLDLYMRQPSRDRVLLIDDIRLEAGPLQLLELEAARDPLASGRLRVAAKFNRRAALEVVVRDGQGVPAGYARAIDTRIEYEWEPAPGASPQAYEVTLAVSDSLEGRSMEIPVGEVPARPVSGRPQLAAWGATPVEKLFPRSWPRIGREVYEFPPAAGAGPLRADLARNEQESVQLALLSRGQAELEAAVGPLLHADGRTLFPPGGCRIDVVGYVKTESPGEYAVDFAGWWPDPLLPVSRVAARAGEATPLWLTFATADTTAPGVYRGSVEILADGQPAGSVPLQVTVHHPVLPDSTTVRTAFSLYDDMLEKIYGREIRAGSRSRRGEGIYLQYRDFIAAHRLNVTHLYRRSPPGGPELAELAVDRRLNAANLVNLRARDYTEQELAAIADSLEPTVRFLRSRGLLHLAFIYGFDEATAAEFDNLRAAFGYMKRRFPDVKTATTAKDPSYGLESGLDEVVDIWVPLTALYDETAAAAARARGKEVWWYICIGPTHPFANWFIEYPLLEARLLWWMTWRRGVTGFLYYTLNRWPHLEAPLRTAPGSNRTGLNPASFGTANGDGCLIYPGEEGPVSSLRFENVRDGIEDYELLQMLSLRKGDAGAAGRRLCGRLIRSLTDFTGDPEEFMSTRRQLLAELDSLAVGSGSSFAE